jgi:hypothetical protein
MPYLNGVRVSLAEWQRANGSNAEQLHTGPNGENPAPPVELDPETNAPKSKPVSKAGSRRSSKGKAKVAAAIATATGTELPDITGLDAGAEDSNDPE